MREYGPTVFPAYIDAAITGTRSVAGFLDEIAALGEDDIDRLRTMLGLATPLEPAGPSGTPPGAAAATEDPAPPVRSAYQIRLAYQRALRERGVA